MKQREAVEFVCRSRNQVVAVRGVAGAGKTTMPKALAKLAMVAQGLRDLEWRDNAALNALAGLPGRFRCPAILFTRLIEMSGKPNIASNTGDEKTKVAAEHAQDILLKRGYTALLNLDECFVRLRDQTSRAPLQRESAGLPM
jgi:ABC-type Mn2+/Zn2+ transport system ATPase subunit